MKFTYFVAFFACLAVSILGERPMENIGDSSKEIKSSRFIYDGRYYEISALALNWFSARHACKDIGMELLSIETAEENLAVLQEISSESDNFWISGTDLGDEGIFLWDTTGRSVDAYTYWGSGEPNNNWGNEHCVKMLGSSYHHWNDNKCEDVERFICEQIVQCK